MVDYLGLILILLLTLNAWGWISVLRSEARMSSKLLWTAMLPVPLFGWLLWFMFGPRET